MHILSSIKVDKLEEIVDTNNGNLIEKLNKELLNEIGNSFNIDKSKLSGEGLNNWNLEYIHYIVSNQEMLESRNMDNALELYNSLMRATLENRFNEFIFDTTKTMR